MNPRDLLQLWSLLQLLSEEVRSCQIIPVRVVKPWLGSHIHAVPTIVACLEGSLRIKIDAGKHVNVRKGEVFILQSACVHQHLVSRHKSVEFSQGFREQHSDIWLNSSNIQLNTLVSLHPYQKLLKEIMRTESQDEQCHLFQAYLQKLLNDQHSTPSAANVLAVTMYEFICQQRQRNIDVADVIAISGLSQSRAYAIFKKHYGNSPHYVLRRERCLLAQAYLRAGYNVGESASKSGFPGPRHMTRAFNEIVGCAPRDWLCKE